MPRGYFTDDDGLVHPIEDSGISQQDMIDNNETVKADKHISNVIHFAGGMLKKLSKRKLNETPEQVQGKMIAENQVNDLYKGLDEIEAITDPREKLEMIRQIENEANEILPSNGKKEFKKAEEELLDEQNAEKEELELQAKAQDLVELYEEREKKSKENPDDAQVLEDLSTRIAKLQKKIDEDTAKTGKKPTPKSLKTEMLIKQVGKGTDKYNHYKFNGKEISDNERLTLLQAGVLETNQTWTPKNAKALDGMITH